MSGDNLKTIQGLYGAFATGDIPTVLAGLSPDIVWNEGENFLYADGNPYKGPDAVLNGVFARIGAEWDSFAAIPEHWHDAGDTIVVRGRYTGVYKATGKSLNAQFVHVWTLKDGKAVAFQQYTDTLQAAQVAGRS